jgi:hypothetical protein
MNPYIVGVQMKYVSGQLTTYLNKFYISSLTTLLAIRIVKLLSFFLNNENESVSWLVVSFFLNNENESMCFCYLLRFLGIFYLGKKKKKNCHSILLEINLDIKLSKFYSNSSVIRE